VGFALFGIAEAARWILPGFDWRTGLLLGAVVTTTDAIAASSIARKLGLPKRIIDVLEGESLINDASGLLTLEFTVALVVTGDRPSYAESGGRLLSLVLGGVFIGLIIGKVVYRFESYIDDAPIETTISLVTPLSFTLQLRAFTLREFWPLWPADSFWAGRVRPILHLNRGLRHSLGGIHSPLC
jgi:NhaP-type Na+/H+ or K+/H+ antiporter